jgi:hypothetical protein
VSVEVVQKDEIQTLSKGIPAREVMVFGLI